MNAKARKKILSAGVTAFLLGSGAATAAFKVDTYTIDGGGGRSTGPTFSVTGTTGQADADPLQPSVSNDPGQRFSVTGGFWAFPFTATARIFHDGFE
jgi:hypothetical protein